MSLFRDGCDDDPLSGLFGDNEAARFPRPAPTSPQASRGVDAAKLEAARAGLAAIDVTAIAERLNKYDKQQALPPQPPPSQVLCGLCSVMCVVSVG